MAKLPKQLTTVISFSKTIALLLVIALPFLGFYVGIKYENLKENNRKSVFELENKPSNPAENALLCEKDSDCKLQYDKSSCVKCTFPTAVNASNYKVFDCAEYQSEGKECTLAIGPTIPKCINNKCSIVKK